MNQFNELRKLFNSSAKHRYLGSLKYIKYFIYDKQSKRVISLDFGSQFNVTITIVNHLIKLDSLRIKTGKDFGHGLSDVESHIGHSIVGEIRNDGHHELSDDIRRTDLRQNVYSEQGRHTMQVVRVTCHRQYFCYDGVLKRSRTAIDRT